MSYLPSKILKLVDIWCAEKMSPEKKELAKQAILAYFQAKGITISQDIFALGFDDLAAYLTALL